MVHGFFLDYSHLNLIFMRSLIIGSNLFLLRYLIYYETPSTSSKFQISKLDKKRLKYY